ncbi:hypothetical protein LPB86_10360 [Pedobacter sp. MC2016-14]|uniref:MutS-related protein n=1 Tax=Pedobacter sp. MC2016-14 TaxID=2897327 RepID=UPI001E399475|nr:hypothetical protein [Pedobacter sp. MC2016-14]MCD0488636.1 hypothetical protein [Pedobacter sp. MC2016-14]
MQFATDRQTLEDLNIFGKHGNNSVFAIFNKTVTRGGAALLEEMFRYPLTDEKVINRRSGIIQYFAGTNLAFPFDTAIFDAIEQYLLNTDERTKLLGQEQSATKRLSNLIAMDTETLIIHKGIDAVVDLIRGLQGFVTSFELKAGHPYQEEMDGIRHLLSSAVFESVAVALSKSKRSAMEDAELDVLFRFRERDLLQKLLRQIYFLDVYLSLAKVANSKGFCFPKALPGDHHYAKLEGLYHPQIINAVTNSIEITPNSNVIFLTGANMAGKSTLMKSLSVALYLAHMGFPIAAVTMEFSVLDGIFTTINLPDDLGMGASHFYAEVLRAKKVANELKTKNLFVLFDELFRGTNVKDAAEATIAFTEAFAKKRDSMFMISTHIIEAGEILKTRCENINFVYLPTRMEGTKPVYTYKLEKGLTADRHGMVIIKNEGILELLERGTLPSVWNEFIVDKQTLTDLNLLGKYKQHSIYNIFNKVHTKGGERLLQEMFQHPLLDADLINERSTLFKCFEEMDLEFPFEQHMFEQAESYLGMAAGNNYLAVLVDMLVAKGKASFLHDGQFDLIYGGLLATVEFLNVCYDFVKRLSAAQQLTNQVDHPYKKEVELLELLFAEPDLQWIKLEHSKANLSIAKVARYDFLLKHKHREKLAALLTSVYRLDVFISVANVAKERGFAYANALPKELNVIRSTALWHPALLKGIANPVSFNQQRNMIFLTGANMAGKSTFMKAAGIAVYLAHLGFPVAARDMQFSVLDGLYSSINVPDNLNMGYSHFYAEVLRVKHVAEEVASGKNMLVLFDELFKGTNVKDAYDGTLEVSRSFAKYRNCSFIISTHIIEVGTALKEEDSNLQFSYLPTVMEGNKPTYTYVLQEGITTDRQGMMIIENEGILEVLN